MPLTSLPRPRFDCVRIMTGHSIFICVNRQEKACPSRAATADSSLTSRRRGRRLLDWSDTIKGCWTEYILTLGGYCLMFSTNNHHHPPTEWQAQSTRKEETCWQAEYEIISFDRLISLISGKREGNEGKSCLIFKKLLFVWLLESIFFFS